MDKKIFIGADIVPTETNYELFKLGNVNELIGKELFHKLKQADFIIMNLETPLCDSFTPIPKCGPNLCAPENTIVGLSKINPYFFTLANNHILDQGENGLRTTINNLRKYNIEFAGAGENLFEAERAYVKEIKGYNIGIYCCTEHEFSIATEESWGANPFDPLVSFDRVRELKEKVDYVIVLYHGGKELYRYPSPNLKKTFRKFADSGADLVIAQHTHCIGCEEDYNGSKLIYGQGNFLFDHSSNEYWKTSLLIELVISGETVTVRYLPLKKKDNVVRVADAESANKIMADFWERSEKIKDEKFIQNNYEAFAAKYQIEYYARFRGRLRNNILFRIIDKLLGHRILKYIYSSDSLLAIENCIDCEAHRELLLTGIKLKRKELR